jgi:hypothetical protein
MQINSEPSKLLLFANFIPRYEALSSIFSILGAPRNLERFSPPRQTASMELQQLAGCKSTAEMAAFTSTSLQV